MPLGLTVRKPRMAQRNILKNVVAGVSLIMSVVAFALGSAPFTPALALVVLAVPLAVGASWFGAWRVSVLSLYFCLSALITAPASRVLPLRVDSVLLFQGVVGVSIAGLFLYGYLRKDGAA